MTPGDVGTTISLFSGTSPEFDYYASMLTSGQDDYFTISVNFIEHGARAKTSSGLESEWLNKSIMASVPDFYGYNVTEIALTINSLTLDSPGYNPNGDGIWTDYTFDGTFTISGELVPVPSAVILGSIGLTFCGWLLRRRGML